MLKTNYILFKFHSIKYSFALKSRFYTIDISVLQMVSSFYRKIMNTFKTLTYDRQDRDATSLSRARWTTVTSTTP